MPSRVLLIWTMSSFSMWAGYIVTIDTSTQSGVTGGLYLQFNPGANSAPVTVTLTDFLSDSVLMATPAGWPAPNGAVTGTLGGVPPLELSNTAGLNDITVAMILGTVIRFRAEFVLPAVLTGTSGNAFSFGITAGDGLTPLLTNDPFGFAGQITISESGQFATAVFPDSGGGPPPASIVADIPEPSSAALLAAGLMLIWARRQRVAH